MAASLVVASLFTIICILNVPSVNVAKRDGRDEILRVTDVKDLKKHLRTHNNVLVIFAKSEKSVSDWKVLGDVAMEMRGLASLVFIDCGEDKKVCKKLKVSPSTVEMKHYHEGEFNKDYDRKSTVKSICNFLRDPKGDIPWEEEATAQDVIHLDNKQGLNKLLGKEKKPMLIMFYAPWCGFCKKMKPDYALAATDLKGEAVLVGMDVDRPENMAVRTDYNITGFPTLLYFEQGKMKYKYGGENNRDGLVKWMKDPSPGKEPEKEAEWADEETGVAHLTDAGFDDFIANNPSVLVMFYAPWCGHCKKMKPEYEQAAAALKDQEIVGIFAGVDATKEKELGERFKVKGFPTVKYFKDGEALWDFNERTADKMVDFMKDPKEPAPPPPPEASWAETESDVYHLTDETFKPLLKKKKHTLVMFYAPWCGHCKKAKPEFMEAAAEFKDESKVAYAAVDCTMHASTCQDHEVTGYPTFKYFNYGKSSEKYTGGRERADFVTFMKDPQNPLASIPPPPPAAADPTEHWGDAPGNENLYHLTDEMFEGFLKEHDSVLVMFYAPWCGHCKSMKPAYAEAASLLKETGTKGTLATLDATANRLMGAKYEVKGYPTLKYFKDGAFEYDYSMGRKTVDFVSFMRSPRGPPPPEPSWSDTPSQVEHLTTSNFASVLAEKSHVLVMFYAPWCGHCKKAKPEVESAAEVLADDSERYLAAVDCTNAKDICQKYEVKGYPTFKYFHQGVLSADYDGERVEKGFVAYLKNPPSKTEPTSDETEDKKDGKDKTKEEL